jgi:hypothetical protein
LYLDHRYFFQRGWPGCGKTGFDGDASVLAPGDGAGDWGLLAAGKAREDVREGDHRG